MDEKARFAKKQWLLYYNRTLYDSRLISRKEYQLMRQKILIEAKE